MELILVAVALVLTAMLVMRESHPRPSTRVVPAKAAVAPVTTILPGGAGDDDDMPESPLGVPHPDPNPDRLIQTEVVVAVRPFERSLAAVRLVSLVLITGAAAGGSLLLIGRGIGAVLRRVAGS